MLGEEHEKFFQKTKYPPLILSEGTVYPYRYNTDLTYLSVPVRSLYLALPHITLTEEEAQAIVYHDGQYIDDNRSVAKNECPLALLLQYADNWCGFVVEDFRVSA